MPVGQPIFHRSPDVIESLRIQNLVIVDDADLELGEGLTCITGETGAGKSLLLAAVDLLLGGDAGAHLVGPAADEAWIEAAIDVPDEAWDDPALEPFLALRPAAGEPLVLARRIFASGRSRSFAWGRTISRSDLRAAGDLLVAVSGQHGQRRLLDPTWHRTIIDAQLDGDAARARQELPVLWRELAAAGATLRDLEEAERELQGHQEQLAADHRMILDLDPCEQEEQQLLAERELIRNQAATQAALERALSLLDGEHGSAGMLAAGIAALRTGAAAGTLGELAERATIQQEVLSDLVRDLRSRLEEVRGADQQAGRVEERLGEYDELHRRFGGTTEAVIATRDRLAARLERLGSLDADLERARVDRDRIAHRLDQLAGEVSAARRRAAAAVARRCAQELERLGMSGCSVAFDVSPAPLGPTGSDRVELLVAANPGIDPAPVRSAASGGELSRIALALQVAAGRGEAPVLVFDEVDAGIGGRTAHAVAGRLVALASTAQVLCVTHLPQVAARATSIVTVDKADGRTRIERVDGEEAIVAELVRMAGAAPGDETALAHARALREGRFGRDQEPAAAGPPARRPVR